MKRQEMVFDPFQLLGKKDRKELTRLNGEADVLEEKIGENMTRLLDEMGD